MAEVFDISGFIELVRKGKSPLFDTRSESEFQKAHIPGALNLPLLRNDERIQVGTLYKQQGRVEAIKKGFELVGPRFSSIITEAEKLAPEKDILLYCWRGGMRSNIMAWLLQMAGFRVSLLRGGYKAFRQWALESLNEPRQIFVVGGKTGSGKTELLQEMQKNGHQVIDLEGLAHHKGSAFGALGQLPQPSNEHFENLLALQWTAIKQDEWLWLENESRSIGSNLIPAGVYEQLRKAPVVEIVLDLQERKKRILSEYGIFPGEKLAENTLKLAKRLGGNRLKIALHCLDQGDLNGWVDIMLEYYDQAYQHSNGLRKPEDVFPVYLEHDRMNEHINRVIAKAGQAIAGQTTESNQEPKNKVPTTG